MSDSSSYLPVLVVGEGPTGLALALSLTKHGIPLRIIEKQPHHPRGFRGSGIQSRTLELHHLLGTLPDILKKSRHIPRMRMYALPGGTEVLKEFYMDNTERDQPSLPSCPYMFTQLLHQSLHEGVIRSHLEREGVSVELSTTLEKYEQHDDHVVATIVKPNGEKEIVKCSFLVGTDGARGVVRRSSGFSFDESEKVVEANIILGDMRMEKGPDAEVWNMWGDPATTMITLLYTGFEDVYGVAVLSPGIPLKDNDTPLTRDWLVNKFHEITERTDLQFGEAVYLNTYRPHARMATEFSKGRVFLAGDAAHVHSAAGGQGLNSSIQDSINLAWKLALYLKGHAPLKLLDSYSAERTPVIASMLHRTTDLHRLTFSSGTSVQGMQRGGLLKQLGINYRTSPIVVDERTPGSQNGEIVVDPYDSISGGLVCAGDRAPDAPNLKVLGGAIAGTIGDETRLFDVFGVTWHTVLVFNPPDENTVDSVIAVTKAYPQLALRSVVIIASEASAGASNTAADLVVVDSEGHAKAGYKVDKPVVVVVRPDAFIGGILVSGAEGLKKYVEGLVV